MTFQYCRRVGWVDVDPSQNYQFTAALRYVEEAEIAWMRDLGILDVLYPHLPRTFVQADFLAPARFDDSVLVSLSVDSVGRSSVQYRFELTTRATRCATGRFGVAYVGADGRAAPLPQQARAALDQQATPGGGTR